MNNKELHIDDKPYAYEYSVSNGDGTYSIVIDRGTLKEFAPRKYEYVAPKNASRDIPVKKLYTADPQSIKYDSWEQAISWIKNNYQDYPNIESLCDAMRTAASLPREEVPSVSDIKPTANDVAAKLNERDVAVRNAALEEAARICEYTVNPSAPATTSSYAYWHACKIRDAKTKDLVKERNGYDDGIQEDELRERGPVVNAAMVRAARVELDKQTFPYMRGVANAIKAALLAAPK